jgi:restriction system protein
VARTSANRQRGRQGKHKSGIKEKGLQALVVGIGLLLMSFMVSGNGLLAAMAPAIRTPAWLAIGLGLMLLGIHFVTEQAAAAGSSDSDVPRPSPRSMARAATSDVRAPVDKRQQPAPLKAAAAEIQAETVRHKEGRWSPAVFAAIEWRRFEAVCEALFAQAGFETRAQSHGADGGVDIWLHSKNAEGPVSVVQCKHWQGKPVTVKEMREFLGVMVSKGLKRGTYATTSRYTADALEFAKANGINAQDGNGLLGLIAQRTPEQQTALLAVAYEGEYWKPTCASCGIKLVERKPAKGGAPFWGCSNFPRCKTRIYMTAKA